VQEPDFHVVRTFEELRRWVRAFAEGHLGGLFLIGDGGCGKTTALAQVLPPLPDRIVPRWPGGGDEGAAPAPSAPGGGARWLRGRVSPVEFYRELHDHLDRLFVLDDVDIQNNPEAQRLLKAICEIQPAKTISWATQNKLLREEGIPASFETRTRVAMIGNSWATFDKNVGAIEDRGHLLKFAPSAAEIHREATTWFADAEILAYFADRLDRIHAPSLRLYVKAKEVKVTGTTDWRAYLEERFAPPDEFAVVRRLKADTSFRFENDRVTQFHAETGLSRAQYFRIAKELKLRPRDDTPHPSAPDATRGIRIHAR
jgi:hypothetical protein